MRHLIFILSIIIVPNILAQPAGRKMTRQEYIETYKDLAIKEMLRTGIPASITLAQAILESNNGNSPLAQYANNHFGIKCHTSWDGERFIMDDDEKNECFRKYKSVYESFRDHSEFLANRRRYAFLFEYKTTDYKAWARGLKKAGYATNPKYADLLIYLIEKYELYRYDKLSKVPPRNIAKDHHAKDVAVQKRENRLVKMHNRIKYIIVKPGDTYFKIAKDFDMSLWQIYKYNDLNENDPLKPGQIIYLQPKRNKAPEKVHIVKKGETMHDISQLYGVKLKKLYKYNHMFIGTEPQPGTKIYLSKTKQ